MGHAHSFLSPGIALGKGNRYSIAELDAETRNHMRVLRLSAGETFSILNGEGSLFDARMETKDAFEVVGVLTKAAADICIELCLSFPKKDSLWEVISQATELGVTKIMPLVSQHNQNPHATRAKLSEKAQRIADEACCQCRQAFRVEVSSEWITLETATRDSASTLVFADESTAEDGVLPGILSEKKVFSTSPIRLFIGPEGGWSESERSLLGERALPMSLGANVLRVSTATAVAIYHLRYLNR